jgi:hypothetical protein
VTIGEMSVVQHPLGERHDLARGVAGERALRREHACDQTTGGSPRRVGAEALEPGREQLAGAEIEPCDCGGVCLDSERELDVGVANSVDPLLERPDRLDVAVLRPERITPVERHHSLLPGLGCPAERGGEVGFCARRAGPGRYGAREKLGRAELVENARPFGRVRWFCERPQEPRHGCLRGPVPGGAARRLPEHADRPAVSRRLGMEELADELCAPRLAERREPDALGEAGVGQRLERAAGDRSSPLRIARIRSTGRSSRRRARYRSHPSDAASHHRASSTERSSGRLSDRFAASR